MRCFMLQDLTTIRGNGSVTTITQAADAWVDVSAFSDLVFWLEVTELIVSAAFFMNYETATIKDDGAFASMASVALGTGMTVTTVFKETATVPPAKWVRWKLSNSSGSVWDATLRILVAANSGGSGARRSSLARRSELAPDGELSIPLHRQPSLVLSTVVPARLGPEITDGASRSMPR